MVGGNNDAEGLNVEKIKIGLNPAYYYSGFKEIDYYLYFMINDNTTVYEINVEHYLLHNSHKHHYSFCF